MLLKPLWVSVTYPVKNNAVMNTTKLKILFLCTGNSCRSQMAEGWARHLKSEEIDAFSAGVEKHGMNEYAVRVMTEAGIHGNTVRVTFCNGIAHPVKQSAGYMRIFCVMDYMNIIYRGQYLRGGIFAVIINYTDISKFFCSFNQFLNGFFLIIGGNDN